jgi:hypothetical protein
VSVILELAAGAQPGYVPQVATNLRFLLRHLDEASFEGVDKAGFPKHVLKAVGRLKARPEVRLQLLRSISELGWWCDLKLADSFAGELAAAARSICLDSARKLTVRMDKPHPDALRDHAVFVGQLMGPYHSPTIGAVEYVRALIGDPEVRSVRVYHSGTFAAEVQDLARSRWGGDIAKVTTIPIDLHTDYLSEAILEGPFTYHFWCELPLAVHIGVLSLFGPSLMFTCGDVAPAQFADVYWYCHEADYIEGLWRRQGAPAAFAANYRQTRSAPFEKVAPINRRSKTDLGFNPDDTVITTVGNRLGVDIDQAFVDGVAGLVLARPNVRWLMIGKLQDYWVDAFGSVLGPQFAYVDYDKDLAGLLAATDIFANPFRAGGGNTALLAIDAGAVVMTRSDLGDVGAFVPATHRAQGVEAYLAELEALTDHPALRAARLAEQQALLARRLDLDNFGRELKALRHLAYERFGKRAPTALETIFPPADSPKARLKAG